MEFSSGSVNEQYPEQSQMFNSSSIVQYSDHDSVSSLCLFSCDPLTNFPLQGILKAPTSHASLWKDSSSVVMPVKPKVAFRIRSKASQVGRTPRYYHRVTYRSTSNFPPSGFLAETFLAAPGMTLPF